MKQLRAKDLLEIIQSTESPYQITDHKTSLQVLKPHRDPELTNPKTKEDVFKFMEALTEDLEPNMDEVYPNIYIGNRKALLDTESLKKLGIKYIMNAADGDGGLSYVPKSSLPNLDGFGYKGLDINDAEVRHDDYTLNQYLDATNFIHDVVDVKKSKILINCYIGTSRSASCVTFYLIKHKGMAADKALEHMKKIRDIRPSNEGLCHIANFHNKTFGFPLVSGDDLPMDPFRRLLRDIYGKETDC